MPFKKCSFCSNNNRININVLYFKLTPHILNMLALPENYGQFICSEHFSENDIENNKLKDLSFPEFLHNRSNLEHDHSYAEFRNLEGKL